MLTLKGTVTDARTKRPLSKLKVSAWHKDRNISDQLGTDISDNRGRFTIVFDDSKLTTKPSNIFFIVYQDNEVVDNTEDHPLTDLSHLDNIVIEVPLQSPDNQPDLDVAQGTVIDAQSKDPVNGLRVEAWTHNKGKSGFLGMQSTDINGVFTITYEPARAMTADATTAGPATPGATTAGVPTTGTTIPGIPSPGADPDIFFRVFSGEHCIYNTEGTPQKNPGKLYDLVLNIQSDPAVIAPLPQAPVFNRDEVTRLAAVTDRSPKELQQSDPALYGKLLQKAVQQVHNSLVDHFDGNSLEVKLAVRKMDLGGNLQQGQPVVSAVNDLLRNAQLSDHGEREALSMLGSWNAVPSLDDVFNPDVPLKNNTLFARELRKSDLLHAASVAGIADQTADQLAARDLEVNDLDQDSMQQLVDDKVLSAAQADALGFQVNLIQLAAGDRQLADAVKKNTTTTNTASLRDLAGMKRADWATLIKNNNITVPEGADPSAYGAFLRKQVETLYPQDAFAALHPALDSAALTSGLQGVAPLLVANAKIFDNIPFANLSLGQATPDQRAKLQSDYESISTMINRYPGLQIADVLRDPKRTPVQKVAETQRRVQMMSQFYQQNKDLPYLFFDLTPDSEDLAQLSFQNIADADRDLVSAGLRASQRMYQVTSDTEDAHVLMEKGYHAAYQIASDSYANFKSSSALEDKVASKYYQNAQETAKRVTTQAGAIIDYIHGGLGWLGMGKVAPAAMPWLRRLDGFADLFGNQNYCNCAECQSIIGPTAYYVDLMDFIQENVLSAHFTGGDAGNILSPKVRRPDLWNSLQLNCDNTNTLIPYLIIINEVLENYIVTRPGSGYTGSMTDRTPIEDFVYKKLYNLTSIKSFFQPFLLPLAQLQMYLKHFPLDRQQIAGVVLKYMVDTTNVYPQTQFGISLTEYNLITTPTATAPFLNDLYGMVFPAVGTISPQDIQLFLTRMDCTRKDFTTLTQTKFVTLNGTQGVVIQPITSPGSIQPDKEVIQQLTLPFLDRMHRFLRLQRKTAWSLTELDQLLYYLLKSGIVTDANALPVAELGRWLSIQQQLNLKIPELIALFTNIPTEWDPSLFDQLFNLPAFAQQGQWDPTTLSLPFQHPAYRNDLPDTTGTVILHRLLAGLVINDDDLYLLIENLKTSLGSAVDGTFNLTLATLSLLYRHARLARGLKISVAQLFSLLRLQTGVPNPALDIPTKLPALIDVVNWWKGTRYSVDDLTFITGAAVPDDYACLDPAATAATIADEVITEGHLIFAATLFCYIQGITEDQSRSVIAANTAVIETANIRQYRIAAAVTNPSTVAINLPPTITTLLAPSDTTELISEMRGIISVYMQPGAADIADHVLVGIVGLDRAQSQSILDANSTIFQPLAPAELYWLKPAFNPSVTITVPPGIPLGADDAKGLLMPYYVGEIVSTLAAKQFMLTSDKVKALALLGGFDLSNAATGATLAQIVQGTGSSNLLVQLVGLVQKLGKWFNDPAYTSDVLSFVQQHTGAANAVFHIANYSTPALPDIQQTVLFLQLLQDAGANTDQLFSVLTSYDFSTTHRFPDAVLEDLSVLLNAEKGIVTSLNQVLPLPVTDPVTSLASNRALEALDKMEKSVSLVQFLGMGGEALPLMLSTGYDDLSHAVESVVAAIRTKYETEDEYLSKIVTFEDNIREKKRDALTDYFINVLDPVMFEDAHDLYNYFLIDTELMGCARTSRVVAGLSSLQLYVQRCLLNLEQSEDGNTHVLPTDIPESEWHWRKNYRVWEANRKVFLWPENYIEPDLRDDKTPLFKELETELLQETIDAQTVQDAYGKYMKGFTEIAHLQIAGSYHDKGGSKDVMHLFGVTSADPGEYYYRTVGNIYTSQDPDSNQGIVWGSWQKMNVQIPARNVSPIVFNNKLYVFWVEILTKPKNDMIGGDQQFTGYMHTMSVKFTSLNLDGSWTPPQQVSLQDPVFLNGPGTIWDPLVSESERSNFLNATIFPILIAIVVVKGSGLDAAGMVQLVTDAYISGIRKAAKEGDGVLSSTKYPVTIEMTNYKSTIGMDFTQPSIRALFRPDYEVNSTDLKYMHVDPHDNYTLRGQAWNRIFPSPFSGEFLSFVGRDFALCSKVDLFERQATPASYTSSYSVPHNTDNQRLTFFNQGIDFGYYIMRTPGKLYAEAVTARDASPYVVNRINLLSYTANVTTDDLEIVNGSLSDGLLNVNGDLLYLHEWRGFDFFGTTFWPYALKRVGTTLSKQLERRLFEAGFDGLLDISYQEFNVIEDPLPVTVAGFNLYPDTAQNVGKMDTTGSLGVYFREIFFHIPYLIANHLNSQAQYEDAQRWYHYIFNPTSDKLPFDYYFITDPVKKKERELDRVWQFVEFRNHTVETLKDILSDKEAIYAYEHDPFNPHAIARLRLGAYMKNIVMKYIDNLIDWGDSLFAQDTMESVNEATMLYVMALEILGPRPAELGDCGDEADAGMTYDDIYSAMTYTSPDDDYVAGIESIGVKKPPVSKLKANHKYIVSNVVSASEKAAQHVTTGGYFANTYYGSVSDKIPQVVTGANALVSGRAVAASSVEAAPGPNAVASSGATAAVNPSTASAGQEVSSDYKANLKSSTSLAIEGNAYFKGPAYKTYDPSLFFPLPSFGTSFLQQSRVFCIPQNQDLLAYWDRVEDRLYKIRHCMNISGLKQQLALFSPEIDPMMLVRARAEGLSLEDILSNQNGNLPPYRFTYLILKAKEYASTLQSFGTALLIALEKKDGEELNRLRLVQQENIMKMSTKMRDQEIEAAELGVETLQARRDTISQRKDHYKGLIDTGLTGWEKDQQITKHVGNLLMPSVVTFMALSGGFEMIPKIIGMACSTGGDETAKATEAAGQVIRFLADTSLKISDSLALEANFDRRDQGWKFQLDQTESELLEIDKQIKAAQVRVDISTKAKEVHETSIQQIEDTYQFYETKFTNMGLYTWLSTTLQRMYRVAYQDALAMARLAERAYRFEKNDDTTPLLDGNYWDSGHSGLLAGEKLQGDLRSMERKFIETNYRTMEIDQAFSLTQIDPSALLQLKTTGECQFKVPELYFDIFYPGQYLRRIKSARLTIPCVTGPFTNVSATLSLKQSYLRKNPKTGDDGLLLVPPMRSVTIATSTGQADSGVFRLDFHDERYMPFEGAGAVESTWGLILPKSFRPFDYNTINDIILHISYTAEYDGVFREQVEGVSGTIIGQVQTFLQVNPIPRLFSLRQEFSNTFYRLFNQPIGTTVPFDLSDKHFPLFLMGRELAITSAKLILVIDQQQLLDSGGHLKPIDLNVTVKGNGGGPADISSWTIDPDIQLPVANIATSTFTSFQPSNGPLTVSVKVNNAGVFTPANLAPGLPVMNNLALKDIVLLIQYKLA